MSPLELIKNGIIENDLEKIAQGYNALTGESISIGGEEPIAEMPEAVVDDMMRSGRFFDPNELKKWANDPHNKKLRYTNGRY